MDLFHKYVTLTITTPAHFTIIIPETDAPIYLGNQPEQFSNQL